MREPVGCYMKDPAIDTLHLSLRSNSHGRTDIGHCHVWALYPQHIASRAPSIDRACRARLSTVLLVQMVHGPQSILAAMIIAAAHPVALMHHVRLL